MLFFTIARSRQFQFISIYFNQVLALVVYDKLFDDPSIPADAKARARDILNGCKGSSVGSYSDSAGSYSNQNFLNISNIYDIQIIDSFALVSSLSLLLLFFDTDF